MYKAKSKASTTLVTRTTNTVNAAFSKSEEKKIGKENIQKKEEEEKEEKKKKIRLRSLYMYICVYVYRRLSI